MPSIIFINRYFYPDHSATSQILSDLTLHLTARGHTVQVVTSRQIYDNAAVHLPPSETVHGVQVHRVATTRFGRTRLIGRLFDYITFYWSTWRRLVSLAKPGDILVAKTDPPLMSTFAIAAARRRSAHLVNWLQDLYPEIAIELGVPFIKGPIGRALAFLRNRSLRLADNNVVVCEGMATRLRAIGVAQHSVCVIPNWTNDQEVVPVPSEQNQLRRAWQLEGKFVVGYSGNLGRAHEFETVLAAAAHLRNDPRMVFAFIGGGKQLDELKSRVRASKLDNVFRFFPYQDRSVLKFSLSLPDVHWVSLRPELEGLIFPSKVYGAAAAARPILAIATTAGDLARLIEKHECGFVIEPGDVDALVKVLRQAANDPSLCTIMGQRARAMLNSNFSRQKAFERWETMLAMIN